jgi:DNA replication and repair protein RecF
LSFATVQLYDFRNFQHITLQPSPSINIIYGDNGSGKTSLLEALYYLAHARSFRSHISDRVIRHGIECTTLFAELILPENNKTTIGIERNSNGDCKVKLANNVAKSTSELAQLLPIQLINPDSFTVLDSGPRFRRALLDWGLFHVEHPFFISWQRLQRALKQRNAGLRAHLPREQVVIWDEELVTHAEALDQWRAQYCKLLEACFRDILSNMVSVSDITFDYHRGWSRDKALRGLLVEHLPQDYERGFTFYGPHRADLVLKKNGVPLHDVLSRGQQKLVVCALKLAQGALLQQFSSKRCIYLVDDLASELGAQYRQFVLELLKKQQAQVFITALDQNQVLPLLGICSGKLFHVEHGDVKVEHFGQDSYSALSPLVYT